MDKDNMPINDNAQILDSIIGILKFNWLPEDKRKRLLKIITEALMGISIFSLAGCAIDEELPPEPSATEFVQKTPTMSPTDTPVPTPAATTEAEYNEEKTKLGISQGDVIIPSNYITIILYKTASGQYKIAFTLVAMGSQDNYIVDLFTCERLFKFESSTYQKVEEEGNNASVIPVNESLKDVQFLRLTGPLNMGTDLYSYTDISQEMLYNIYLFFEPDSEFYRFHTISELADIYLQLIPKDYRTYASDFTPGNKAIYPNITPSPGPTKH